MLDDSYSACRCIVRRANSSFPLAFRLLSLPKRRAMDALYAFARISDDLADESGEPSEKRERLVAWSQSLNLALSGIYSHPIHWALHDAVQRFDIPRQYLFDVIDGVMMDLEPLRFATFDELRKYCYRVAGAVGLACIRIWGVHPRFTFEQAEEPAEAAGLAFQVTNILRDLAEDRDRGRCYFPATEWTRPELTEPGVPPRGGPAEFDFRLKIEETRVQFLKASALDIMLTNEGRAIFRVMSGTYRALLERIAKDPMAVFERRIRVPKWRKAAIFLSAWPVKWGLR